MEINEEIDAVENSGQLAKIKESNLIEIENLLRFFIIINFSAQSSNNIFKFVIGL